MAWLRRMKELHCDHKDFRQRDGLPGLANVVEIVCTNIVTAATVVLARKLAREQGWQHHPHGRDFCNLHTGGTRVPLRREDYLPVSQRR